MQPLSRVRRCDLGRTDVALLSKVEAPDSVALDFGRPTLRASLLCRSMAAASAFKSSFVTVLIDTSASREFDRSDEPLTNIFKNRTRFARGGLSTSLASELFTHTSRIGLGEMGFVAAMFLS